MMEDDADDDGNDITAAADGRGGTVEGCAPRAVPRPSLYTLQPRHTTSLVVHQELAQRVHTLVISYFCCSKFQLRMKRRRHVRTDER